MESSNCSVFVVTWLFFRCFTHTILGSSLYTVILFSGSQMSYITGEKKKRGAEQLQHCEAHTQRAFDVFAVCLDCSITLQLLPGGQYIMSGLTDMTEVSVIIYAGQVLCRHLGKATRVLLSFELLSICTKV